MLHIDVHGFIHVASPLGGFDDANSAIPIGVNGGLNALKACARVPSVKRVVFTSSSLAATFPKRNVEFSIDENSYNKEAVEAVKQDPAKKGLYIYAALKTETEKAMWKWMQENRPEFVFNTIVWITVRITRLPTLLTTSSYPMPTLAASLYRSTRAFPQLLPGRVQLGPANT